MKITDKLTGKCTKNSKQKQKKNSYKTLRKHTNTLKETDTHRYTNINSLSKLSVKKNPSNYKKI